LAFVGTFFSEARLALNLPKRHAEQAYSLQHILIAWLNGIDLDSHRHDICSQK